MLPSTFVSVLKNWNFWKSFAKSNHSFFASHQNLDIPKIPKHVFTFDLCRHAKSSLTATTNFMHSTKVAIKKCPLLIGISGNNYSFIPCIWLRIVPKGWESVLQYGVFPIFRARFPRNYHLDVFLQSLHTKLPTWASKLD